MSALKYRCHVCPTQVLSAVSKKYLIPVERIISCKCVRAGGGGGGGEVVAVGAGHRGALPN